MFHITPPAATGKRDWTRHTPEQIARECLAETHNDLDRAGALAGRRARGAKLRAVHVAIGNALPHAS